MRCCRGWRPRRGRGHLDEALEQWEKDREAYADAAKSSDAELIHPQFVAQMLDRLAADDAIFTADGGTPMVWLPAPPDAPMATGGF